MNLYSLYKFTLPLAFVRIGYVYLDNGYANYLGREGDIWSRTSNLPDRAWRLDFGSSYVNPSNAYGDRCSGFSLRCLYPGS